MAEPSEIGGPKKQNCRTKHRWNDLIELHDVGIDKPGSIKNEEEMKVEEIQELQNLVIYTDEEMMLAGLQLIGYTERQIKRVKKINRNLDRFRSHFGSNPNVCICIWEDLLTRILFCT